MTTSSEVALQVVQEAISVLAKWAGVNLPREYQAKEEKDLHLAVIKAKKILSWTKDAKIKPLRLLFDAVKLPDGKGQDEDRKHYCPALAIANPDPPIPYPRPEKPTPDALEHLKLQIRDEISQLNLEWQECQNLSLLTLILEKYGSCLSLGESDIAFIDLVRSTAAVASALAHDSKSEHISLVAGDLSGIQKFIYTISSDGALKSLRARSFYLELVTEEVVQQLLAELHLPRTSVIYAGGGNLYLLAPTAEETKTAVNKIHQRFNKWLKNKFQAKIFLTLELCKFPVADVANENFATHWDNLIRELNKQKNRKFFNYILDLLEPQPSYEPCRVCHRDDTEDLERLNNQEDDSVLACPTCRDMFSLGGHLLRIDAIVRSHREFIPDAVDTKVVFNISSTPIYYHLFKQWDLEKAKKINNTEIVLLVNNWLVNNYYADNVVPLLLGKYAQKSSEEEDAIIRAGEMAKEAKKAGCIPRVGYLRMDVDKLGLIFAKGFKANKVQNLPRIAGLSRQISYFFKVYLNSLAKNRSDNLPEGAEHLTSDDSGKAKPRPNLVFIYSGGDDLFISGAWNEVVEFAFDTYQSFQEYTGWNPDITLSGGISINDIKYPLYQAARSSGDAEEAAKANDRNSLGLFGEVFKWEEWLNIEDKSRGSEHTHERYLSLEPRPQIQDILTFVKKLTHKLDIRSEYSRNFIRNLLDTAEIQEQILRKLKEEQAKEEDKNDIRYYLHLPKLAYAFSRLPNTLQDDEYFNPVRQSLLSPRNASYFRAIATWIELLTRSN